MDAFKSLKKALTPNRINPKYKTILVSVHAAFKITFQKGILLNISTLYLCKHRQLNMTIHWPREERLDMSLHNSKHYVLENPSPKMTRGSAEGNKKKGKYCSGDELIFMLAPAVAPSVL